MIEGILRRLLKKKNISEEKINNIEINRQEEEIRVEEVKLKNEEQGTKINSEIEHEIEVVNTEKEKLDEIIDDEMLLEQEEKKEEQKKQELVIEDEILNSYTNYEFPLLSLLEENVLNRDKKEITENALILQKTLHSFGISAKVEDVSVGPVVTRYEIGLADGVRIKDIKKLEGDIALRVGAQSVNVVGNIPRKTNTCY